MLNCISRLRKTVQAGLLKRNSTLGKCQSSKIIFKVWKGWKTLLNVKMINLGVPQVELQGAIQLDFLGLRWTLKVFWNSSILHIIYKAQAVKDKAMRAALSVSHTQNSKKVTRDPWTRKIWHSHCLKKLSRTIGTKWIMQRHRTTSHPQSRMITWNELN